MKCNYTKPDGSRCKSFPMKNDRFCWIHSPQTTEVEKKLASSRGGRSRKASPPALPEIVLNKMQDVPSFLVTTIKRMDAGEIEIRLGTAIGYLSNVLMKSYEIADLEVRVEKVENYIKGTLKGELTDDYEIVDAEA